MSNRSRPQSIISTMSTRSRSQSTLRQRSTERPAKFSKSSPASRNCSPARPSRRVAKLNMYLARSAATPNQDLYHAADALSSPPRAVFVKRWDGNLRTTIKWDSIRRDPELWFSGGDCLIHFYERGFSRRGASLKVSLADIESSNCGPLLDRYYSGPVPSSASTSPESEMSSDSPDYFHSPSSPATHELYIPAPTYLSREEAFQYHLTTRNFFAWMFEKPLVGDRLGRALTSLLERMNEYRLNPEENQDEILAYIDDQGYTDFRDCPDHALAVLQFAEAFQYREVWTDAFVHCTGMNEQLDSSAEFEYTSRASQALITRANIEMDLRLERAGRCLSNFLEDDLSGAYLGLGKEAQLHLERFRSFLHSYYVGQHCYWPPLPPTKGSEAFPKSIYKTMYFDFRNLYDYLVDPTSGILIQDNKPVDGGICVFQNVQAFDKRNKYAPLPHPLPLIPKIPATLSTRRSFGRLSIFHSKTVRLDRRIAASHSLASATNTTSSDVMNSSLVREYLRFEKVWTMKDEETVTCADARKVRWILVYAILQTLISVTRVPVEVRDTEGVAYPLCCQIAGTPPWTINSKPVGSRKMTPQDVEPVRISSLKDQILELGPDMDIVSAKPSPLVVPAKSPKSAKSVKPPSPPHRVSFTNKLSLRAPKPIRTASWEVLSQEYGADVSPISSSDSNTNSPIIISGTNASVSPVSQAHTPVDPLHNFALPTVSPGPFLHSSTFELPIPTHSAKTPDPSTPSASEHSGNSSGWSRDTSEDDMDHTSVAGSDPSNYGDDEDEEPEQKQQQQQTSPKIPTRSDLRPQSQNKLPIRNSSVRSFAPERTNPEIDHYLLS